MKIKLLFLPFTFLFFTCLSFAQTLAPGAPGKDAQWASAGKQAVGTSASLESKVWFTLQGGALTEVYYPDVTVANVHKLEFVVVNPKTKKVETETEDANHKIIYPYQERILKKSVVMDDSPFVSSIPLSLVGDVPSLTFAQINEAKSGEWKITKVYTTDPERSTVLIDVLFEQKNRQSGIYELYVYYDPSISNTGMRDSAWAVKDLKDETQNALITQDGNVSSALMIDHQGELSLKRFALSDITNGFFGTSDGLTQLKNKQSLVNYDRAEKGNIVQFARIEDNERKINPGTPFPFSMILALSFGKTPDEALKTAKASLKKGFTVNLEEYEKGWSDYVKTLRQVEPKYQAQFNMAAMVLKAQEDKTVRGANVASLTVPWGGGVNANEDVGGGYHLVWSRDLYQVVTAYMALNDMAAANRALDFLFKIQQKPDGSFPQNSWLDGKRGWGSLQLDEVAYPLIMAYQLGRFDKATYENHVKKAADFLVKTGPKTPQERWEEKSGYSPSTIAAEIAGLVCAAEIAKKNNDEASATVYLATAADWARNVERWTATTKGKYGDGNYYLRLTENGTPDAGEKTILNNNAGTFLETEIVDAGFLELVRLGIKSPDDPLIVKSLKIIDEKIKVNTPNGEAFYRYNHDGYGEMDDGRRWNWDGKYTGKGRLWALLSGERGQYELALCGLEKFSVDGVSCTDIIRLKRLDSMAKFANEGLMIPEQVWDKPETPKNIDKQFIPELKFGEGTGSATPLAWSMAQFIRLAVNLQEGRNLDTPDVVYNRYVKNGIPGQTGFNISSPDPNTLATLKAGEVFAVKGQAAPNSIIAAVLEDQRQSVKVSANGEFSFTMKMPASETVGYLAIQTPDGATFISPNKIGGAVKKEEKLSAEISEKVKNSKQSPLIEGNKAIFIYRGAAKRVQLAGDFTGWQPRGAVLQDVGENLKAAVMEFPATARVEYKFIIDGNWIPDPMNPNKLDNGVGSENSFFTMPDYQPTIWDKEDKLSSAKIEEIEIYGKIYGKRTVKIYQPLINSNEEVFLPTLYLQDGTDYINRAKAIQIQENLVKAGKTKPFIMVFVDYKDRTKEYWASDDYAKFLATEVVPAIDAKYNTIKNREGRALLGASLGGITSIWVGLKYPEMFGRIGGQSSSFWVDSERVIKELSKLDVSKIKFRFYFDDGTFEGVDDSRRVNVMLRGKGFPVTYREEFTGHNWTSWRDRLADAFIALWKN